MATQGIGEMAENGKALTENVSSKLGQVGERVQDATRETVDKAGTWLRSAADRTGPAVKNSASAVQQFCKDHPAAAVGIGLVVGGLIVRSLTRR